MKNLNIAKKVCLSLLITFASVFALSAQESKACPCCQPEFRQFDFWLGNWETYKPGTDTLLGHNRIVLLQDSCIIQENWTSAQGAYTGTSYNFYNSQTGKWHQTWIDNQGGSLLLSGRLEGKSMVLRSETMKTSKGEPYINRITWTPRADGTVRQHWEISKDDGKTWNTAFDGIYQKVGNP